MTNHREEPEDRADDGGQGPGAQDTRGAGAGPGRTPGREAPGGRPGGEAPGGEGTAGPEAGGTGEDDGSGPAGGRRGGRRAWGDAFSEVQDLVGEVVGDVLEGVRDAASARFPRMDLVRVAGEGYRLLVDLPGMSRADVEVLTLGNELTIRGERARPELPEGSEILRSERAHGKFERTIRMPPEIREEGVAASFEEGVLTVRLPHAEPSDARTVDIG